MDDMDDNGPPMETCDNCKRVFLWKPGGYHWTGYQYLCQACADAYWSFDDERLEDLRLGRVSP